MVPLTTLHPTLSSNFDMYARTLLHTLIVAGGLLVLIASARAWPPAYVLYGVLLFAEMLAAP